MIGTPVSFTLWAVKYRFNKNDQKGVVGEANFSTADPTGNDLIEVCARTVLGRDAEPSHEFTLLHVHRVLDAKGLAHVQSSTSRAPFDEAGALMLENAQLRQRIAELEAKSGHPLQPLLNLLGGS